jgi:hypothetical protein
MPDAGPGVSRARWIESFDHPRRVIPGQPLGENIEVKVGERHTHGGASLHGAWRGEVEHD